MENEEKKPNLDEIKEKFQKAGIQIAKAEKDLEFIESFLGKFDSIEANIKELEKFYFDGNWLLERKLLEEDDPDALYAATGEDTIWNIHSWFHFHKIKLMKKLADSLYNGLPG